MLKIKFNGEEYQIKNHPTEVSVKTFEEISTLLNDESKDEIERYIEIFNILGIPEEVIDNMDYDDFIGVIKAMQIEFIAKDEFQQEFEINGFTYRAFDDEFKLKVKEMSLIESYVKKDSNKFIGELLAILFKRTDLSKIEHFESAHIKHKAELFREHLMIDIALPYIKILSEKLVGNLKLLKNED